VNQSQKQLPAKDLRAFEPSWLADASPSIARWVGSRVEKPERLPYYHATTLATTSS